MNARDRRSCMHICALLASVIIGVVVGSEGLGFTRMQHFEENISINALNKEKVKCAGNCTHMNSGVMKLMTLLIWIKYCQLSLTLI